jgi:hypothetical protein
LINRNEVEKAFEFENSTLVTTLRYKYNVRCKSLRVINSTIISYMAAQLIQEHERVSFENAEAILIQTSDIRFFCHPEDESESGGNDSV